MKDWCDTSRYNTADARPLPRGLNKKEAGLMKDELGGNIMTGFTGFRSKSCAYQKLDGTESKRFKGVKKCMVKSQLTFKDFTNCLMSGKEVIFIWWNSGN